MTETERQAYAREQRERCRPAECAHDPQCWVLWGGKGTLVPESMTKAVRCAACNGKLRWSEWREPPELAMSARAELLARQQAKAVRPRRLAAGWRFTSSTRPCSGRAIR